MNRRKRNERGEETAENLIVKKLKAERIEELLKLVKEGKERCQLIKQELDLVKSGKADDVKLNEVWNRKLIQENAKKQEEIDYKKWLEERQTKIAAMRRGIFQGLPPQKPQSSDTPTTSLKLKTDSSIGSPLSIDIDIDSSVNNSQIGLENKLNLPHSGTSTSPLLTSLLQSPTPSTPTVLPTVNPFQTNAIKSLGTTTTPSPTSQTSQPFFPPTISTTASPSRQIIISTTQTSTGVNLVVSGGGDVIAKNSNSTTVTPSSSPTLSKLLEMPPSVPGKLPPLPIIEAQTSSSQVESQIRTRSSPTKLNMSSAFKNDELKEGGDGNKIEKQEPVKEEKTLRSEKMSTSRGDNKIDNDKQESMEEDVFTENEKDRQNRKDNIAETVDSSKEMMTIQIKKELLDTDSTPSTPANSSLTASSSAKTKRKRNLNVTTVTVTPTRRSGRVKARDLKENIQEENTESNEAQTPTIQPAKKRVSVDETTETSMSEESVDVTKANLLQTSESIPNSPASSTMHSEDADNNKEYKVWKKSIMLAYKTAATHKFASLFFQPVTDEEAEGYSDVVYKPMDLQTIKRKIENGNIRTTVEFQRDIMLMFQNAIMYNSADHDVHQMAVEMQKEIIESIEDFIESQKQINQPSESSASSAKLRSRERRSTAIQGTPSSSSSSQTPSTSTNEVIIH